MTSHKIDIAIIGAGMAAWRSPRRFRRVGFDVVVYEQVKQFTRPAPASRSAATLRTSCSGLASKSGCAPTPSIPARGNNRDWRTGEVLFDMVFGEPAEEK